MKRFDNVHDGSDPSVLSCVPFSDRRAATVSIPWRRLLMIVGGILWGCIFFSHSIAAQPLETGESTAIEVLKKGIDDMISIINSPLYLEAAQAEARADLLFEKADALFDFRAVSRGALSRNWRRFSNAQQQAFTQSFAQLIATTYLSKLDDRSFENLKIEYLKTESLQATKSGIERVDIYTEVHHNDVVTPVDYRMMKSKSEQWKIYDVKIEGVSLVGNYREQYRTRFNDSPETLIREIQEKIAQ